MAPSYLSTAHFSSNSILRFWRLTAIASLLVWIVSVYVLHQVAVASLCVSSHTSSTVQVKLPHSQITNKTVVSDSTIPVSYVNPISCEPKSKLFFLRVHKTGTSTVSTLLYRFALSRGLVIFPVQDHPWPDETLRDVIMLPPGCKKQHGKTFDIFAEHYNLNMSEVHRYFPEPETEFIVSLRHPYPQLRSLFAEFQLPYRLGLPANNPEADPVARFLDGIGIYGSKARIPTKSPAARQLGVPEHLLDDQGYLHNWIKETESRFASVIITEYFAESMVLLRRRMCWSMQDIIYLVQRRNSAMAFRHNELNYTQEVIHRNWSYADYALYQHFSRKLYHKLAKENNISDELVKYRGILHRVEHFCKGILSQLRSDPKHVYSMYRHPEHLPLDGSPWSEPFNVSSLDCAIMKLDTTVLRNIAKVTLMPELCDASRVTQKAHKEFESNFNIRWTGDDCAIVDIHRDYCRMDELVYKGVPLAILGNHAAYMSLD